LRPGHKQLKFLESEIVEDRENLSIFHVIPAPMEFSVSYGGGTASGPQAILEASDQLEAWDDSQGLDLVSQSGIHTTLPVDCKGDPETVLKRIENSVTRALSFNAIPVLLGGEHTVTLGALRALKNHLAAPSGTTHASYSSHPYHLDALEPQPFGIIQIDAHADLRDSYEGSRLSHACVMRRAVDELGIPLFQLGVRAISSEEVSFRREQKIPFIDARELYLKGLPENLLPAEFPEKIYITLDVDGLDPSVIRATGTPVPGGIGWHDTLTLLEKSITGREVIGFDIVELAPVKGDHASDFAAAQLTYSVMGMIQRLKR